MLFAAPDEKRGIGLLPEVDGFLFATGLSGGGLGLDPILGKLTADIINRNERLGIFYDFGISIFS